MFSLKRNASKAALLRLALKLFADGMAFIDCQIPTPHLTSLGGVGMSRKEFLILLKDVILPQTKA
jgi:leucyl/phenylalanyl-tRNA--protein transferase